MRSRPSASAWALTAFDPGTTHAEAMVDATRRPSTTAAAARRSPMRLSTHEPMNTSSIGVPSIGSPGVRRLYSMACR